MGLTVGARSWKNGDFCVFSGRLRKSVTTLSIVENTISVRVFRRQRVVVFE
jgi:hypothetical protein